MVTLIVVGGILSIALSAIAAVLECNESRAYQERVRQARLEHVKLSDDVEVETVAHTRKEPTLHPVAVAPLALAVTPVASVHMGDPLYGPYWSQEEASFEAQFNQDRQPDPSQLGLELPVEDAFYLVPHDPQDIERLLLN